MRNTCVVLCVIGLLAWTGTAWASDVNWSYAGSGNWATSGNWDAGAPPTAAQSASLPDTLAGAYTVTVDQAGAVTSGLSMNVGPATLLVQSGGDFTTPIITFYGDVASVYRQTGGTAHIGGIRNSRWGNNGGNFGTFEISGGTLLPTYLTNVDGKIVDPGYRTGQSATRGGNFHVIGSAASITILGGEEAAGYGAWEQRGYGTLIAELDAGGISTVVVDTSVSIDLLNTMGDNAEFEISSGEAPVIDIRGVAPTLNTSYTLLTADHVKDEGVVLDASDLAGGDWGANYWTLTVTEGTDTPLATANNGDNGSVVVTYVPEPATLSLLAVGLVGLIRRRRR